MNMLGVLRHIPRRLRYSYSIASTTLYDSVQFKSVRTYHNSDSYLFNSIRTYHNTTTLFTSLHSKPHSQPHSDPDAEPVDFPELAKRVTELTNLFAESPPESPKAINELYNFVTKFPSVVTELLNAVSESPEAVHAVTELSNAVAELSNIVTELYNTVAESPDTVTESPGFFTWLSSAVTRFSDAVTESRNDFDFAGLTDSVTRLSEAVTEFSNSVAESQKGVTEPVKGITESAKGVTESPEEDVTESPYQSRNEKKRLAHHAIITGMQLTKFSTPQIKRILKVASLGKEVLNAILVAKTLRKEAKRRQFNLIGKLIREVDRELMDSLMLATIEGDKQNFEKLFGLGSWDVIEEEEDDSEDIESEDDEEDSGYRNDMVERWYDGLINKDISITNEVYSLHDVEFDRQELRRLVRTVQSGQGNQISSEEKVEEAEAKQLRAEISLTRFLWKIVKQMPED